MTNEQFIEQNKTFVKFIQIYCDDKHANNEKIAGELQLFYNGFDLNQTIKFNLCKDCKDLLLHVNDRLNACPNDPKPKCRHCSAPCYEKNIYKKIAKIMRSSGIKLGLGKIKKVFRIG